MKKTIVRWAKNQTLLIFLVAALLTQFLHAQDSTSQQWNLHFQETIVTQWHYRFYAQYTGMNSLRPESERQTSLTSTLFFGSRLWRQTEIFFNPEISGGQGLSGTTGVAGFPNGETFRIGEPTPTLFVGRVYFKQTFGFTGETETVKDDLNQLSGSVQIHRLTLIGGKFALSDFLDDNIYSHDPRTQFLNWSLMSNGAWDYAADTRGYTWGVFTEYDEHDWSFRAAASLVPKEANGLEMDTRIQDAFSLNAEFERRFQLNEKKGAFRFLLYRNQARMGNYREAIDDSAYHTDITQTRSYSRSKYGFDLNAEQQLSADVGMFARIGWNDGVNETWAFTEIDRSFSVGTILTGTSCQRPQDQVGAAFVINGLSKDHADYLAAGGYGFIIGDGKLNYGAESILEVFYSLEVSSVIKMTGDYQFILNPGYNGDRGPVHVFAIRMHTEI
jgi:high affinity Mn2+ porin